MEWKTVLIFHETAHFSRLRPNPVPLTWRRDERDGIRCLTRGHRPFEPGHQRFRLRAGVPGWEEKLANTNRHEFGHTQQFQREYLLHGTGVEEMFKYHQVTATERGGYECALLELHWKWYVAICLLTLTRGNTNDCEYNLKPRSTSRNVRNVKSSVIKHIRFADVYTCGDKKKTKKKPWIGCGVRDRT